MKVVFKGTYKALEPIHQTKPEMKDRGEKKGVTTEQNCIVIFSSDDSGHLVRKITLPVVNVRGLFRDLLADEVSSAVGKENLDFKTLSILFTGGTFGKKNKTPQEKEKKQDQTENSSKESKQKSKQPKKAPVNVALEREKYINIIDYYKKNIVVSLLGGSIGKTMFRGKACISYLLPSESYRRSGERLIEVLHRAKMDDFTRDHSLTKALSPYAMTDYLEGKAKDDVSNQMVLYLEYIPAGVKFDHSISIFDADEVELGAMLSILRRFSAAPYVGACRSIGFGRVKFEYTVDIDDLSIGKVLLENNVFMMSSPGEDIFERALKAYEEHLKSLTPERIMLPEILSKIADEQEQEEASEV